MPPIYLGVDVAGAKNTWVAALSSDGNGQLSVKLGPTDKKSLKVIVDYCDSNDVVAVAIDAPLAMTLTDENGLRESDECLKKLLMKHWEANDCQNWVMSFNSLQAVPIRGGLLADHLSPMVGTVLETHPRASLLFGLGRVENREEIQTSIRDYKSGKIGAKARMDHVETLWQSWSSCFGVACEEPVLTDGALDSLVCATVAYCFHHAPEKLHRLRHEAPGKVGRGPFYVMSPNADTKTG